MENENTPPGRYVGFAYETEDAIAVLDTTTGVVVWHDRYAGTSDDKEASDGEG